MELWEYFNTLVGFKDHIEVVWTALLLAGYPLTWLGTRQWERHKQRKERERQKEELMSGEFRIGASVPISVTMYEQSVKTRTIGGADRPVIEQTIRDVSALPVQVLIGGDFEALKDDFEEAYEWCSRQKGKKDSVNFRRGIKETSDSADAIINRMNISLAGPVAAAIKADGGFPMENYEEILDQAAELGKQEVEIPFIPLLAVDGTATKKLRIMPVPLAWIIGEEDLAAAGIYDRKDLYLPEKRVEPPIQELLAIIDRGGYYAPDEWNRQRERLETLKILIEQVREEYLGAEYAKTGVGIPEAIQTLNEKGEIDQFADTLFNRVGMVKLKVPDSHWHKVIQTGLHGLGDKIGFLVNQLT